MADDIAGALITGLRPDVILVGDVVCHTREGKLDGSSGIAGDREARGTGIGRRRDLGVKSCCIVRGHEDVTCSCINDGGSAAQTGTFAVVPTTIDTDLP